MALRIAWITDPHLNFLPAQEAARWIAGLAREPAGVFLLGGDVAHSPQLLTFLAMFDEALDCPVYFVLGNHDFYQGSVAGTRAMVREWSRRSRRLTYLDGAGVVRLTTSTCLLGCDGWGDAGCGDYDRSTVVLNDHLLIEELRGLSRARLRFTLHALGREGAAGLREALPTAIQEYEHLVVLTHVPPFREACWHEGRISDSDFLPFFVCSAAGEVLRETMRRHPTKRMTVLCGHTHSPGLAQILDNLAVKTGGAVYGSPQVQEVFTVA